MQLNTIVIKLSVQTALYKQSDLGIIPKKVFITLYLEYF